MHGRDYKNVPLSVMPGLCADVVLGQDFLSQHHKVVIKLSGPRETLLIQNDSFCGVAACEGNCDRLLQNLKPDWKPIVTKSRKYNQEDKQFIDAQVSKLLKDDIIEPSHSTWRAQVLVSSNERHKPPMVVTDY